MVIDTSGVHLWLVLWKATRAVETHARGSIEEIGLGSTGFAVLEALLHKGPLPVGEIGQAEVTVRLEEDGKTVNGQGADADTLVASARAYLHALNKLSVKREKTAPAALSA